MVVCHRAPFVRCFLDRRDARCRRLYRHPQQLLRSQLASLLQRRVGRVVRNQQPPISTPTRAPRRTTPPASIRADAPVGRASVLACPWSRTTPGTASLRSSAAATPSPCPADGVARHRREAQAERPSPGRPYRHCTRVRQPGPSSRRMCHVTGLRLARH